MEPLEDNLFLSSLKLLAILVVVGMKSLFFAGFQPGVTSRGCLHSLLHGPFCLEANNADLANKICLILQLSEILCMLPLDPDLKVSYD